MGWRGAGNNGASGTGTYFFFGGLLMLLGSLGEVSRIPIATETGTNTVYQWIIGNTFPFVVFGSFSAYWLGFAATLTPEFNAYGAYSTDPNNLAEGINTVGFRSGFGMSSLPTYTKLD
jgi:hypothetical protein